MYAPLPLPLRTGTMRRMTYDPKTGGLKPWWKRPWGVVVLVVAGLLVAQLTCNFVFVEMVSRG